VQQSLAASAAGGARPPARQPAPLRACAPAAHGGPRRAPCLNASERCPARPGPAPGGASLASAGAPPPASPPSPDMRRSQGAARPQAKSQGGRARAFGSTPSTGGAPLARAAASSASACARPSSPFWRAWKVSSTPQRCRHGSASACSSAAARGARAPGLQLRLKRQGGRVRAQRQRRRRGLRQCPLRPSGAAGTAPAVPWLADVQSGSFEQAAQDADLAQHALGLLGAAEHVRDALERHLRPGGARGSGPSAARIARRRRAGAPGAAGAPHVDMYITTPARRGQRPRCPPSAAAAAPLLQPTATGWTTSRPRRRAACAGMCAARPRLLAGHGVQGRADAAEGPAAQQLDQLVPLAHLRGGACASLPRRYSARAVHAWRSAVPEHTGEQASRHGHIMFRERCPHRPLRVIHKVHARRVAAPHDAAGHRCPLRPSPRARRCMTRKLV